MSQDRLTRNYEECSKRPVFGECAKSNGFSLERPKNRLQHLYVRTDLMMHRVTKRPTHRQSDALIVKTYATSASTTRLTLPSGDGLEVADESRTR